MDRVARRRERTQSRWPLRVGRGQLHGRRRVPRARRRIPPPDPSLRAAGRWDRRPARSFRRSPRWQRDDARRLRPGLRPVEAATSARAGGRVAGGSSRRGGRRSFRPAERTLAAPLRRGARLPTSAALRPGCGRAPRPPVREGHRELQEGVRRRRLRLRGAPVGHRSARNRVGRLPARRRGDVPLGSTGTRTRSFSRSSGAPAGRRPASSRCESSRRPARSRRGASPRRTSGAST